MSESTFSVSCQRVRDMTLIGGYVDDRPPRITEISDDERTAVRNSFAKDIGFRSETGKVIRESWEAGSNRLRWVPVRNDGHYEPEWEKRRRSEASRSFHKLWTACVDKPGYRKTDWRAVELQLLNAGVID